MTYNEGTGGDDSTLVTGAVAVGASVAIVAAFALAVVGLRSLAPDRTDAGRIGSETVASSGSAVSTASTALPASPPSAAGPTATSTSTTLSVPAAPPEPALGADVRSYRMAGGVIVVAFGDQATLVSVDLVDGFTAESDVVDGVLIVDLRDGTRHSELRAWVDGGPQVALDDH